jgi:hypothetical protein
VNGIQAAVLSATIGLLWSAAGGRVAAVEPAREDAEGRAATQTEVFRRDVAPFLAKHCIKCHGAVRQEAGLSLADASAGRDPEGWKRAAERLLLGEMPPEGEPRPSVAALAGMDRWLRTELAEAGLSLADVEARLQLPGQGNRVNHEALFSGEVRGPAASPARIWRCSPQIYAALVPRITGKKPGNYGNGLQVAQPFSTSSAEGFKDFDALFAVDEPTVVQLLRNAEQMVELQPALAKLIPAGDSARSPTEADMRAAVSRQFATVVFREPSETELARFVELMRKNVEASGPAIGMKSALAAVFLLPEALYRSERGAGEPDEHGRRMLAPRELAYSIAFALTDERPDKELLQAAESGGLASRDDVRRQVERLLDEKSIAKPRIMRFFEEYFEFATAVDVFKDFDPPVLKKAWQPEVLVEDTRRLVQYVLDRDRDVLRELLTTNQSFVNYGIDAQGKPAPAFKHPKNNPKLKAQHPEILHFYGLPEDWKWTARQPIEMPAGERVGILTQPSWLAAFATNNENHAIRRGKWIRERLLGDVVPDLPITVDAKLPDAPDKTLRERMEVTHQEYCWNCHSRMNPLGLPLESYDYLGRFRREELGRPVDTSGRIDQAGDTSGNGAASEGASGSAVSGRKASLEGPVADVAELMRKLADSPRVRQVFVRHAFRYWMGRNERLSDSPTLIAADRAYVDGGGSMRALMVSLLTSDSFLYRFDSATDRRP